MERKTKSDVIFISITSSYVRLRIPFVFLWKWFSFCGHFSIPTIGEYTYQEKTKKKETGYRVCDPSLPFHTNSSGILN